MRKSTKSILAKALALAMAFATVAGAAPQADAAKAKKPKLSKSKVTLNVKQKAKIKIKNVKKKQVKKLTVKSAKKSIASVKKNGKTAFTITGKKAGTTKVTASVKVGKKTTKLKVTVKVKGADSPDVTATPATVTPTPTSPSVTSESPAASSSTEPSGKPADEPSGAPSVEPVVKVIEENDFESGLGKWFARYDPAQGNEAKLEISPEAHTGNGAALITGRDNHAWNGPAVDLTDVVTPGASYQVSFWAKVPDADDFYEDGIDLIVSGATKMEEDGEESYENYPTDGSHHIAYGEWTEVKVEFTVSSAISSYIFYIETKGKGKSTFLIDDFVLTRLTMPAEFDKTLPSIKDTYASYVDTVGTAVSYDTLLNPNTLGFVKHHYNSITLGNAMKPDALLGSKKTLVQTDEAAAEYIVNDAYKEFAANKDEEGNVIVPEINFTETDKILKLCKENNLKLRFHTLVWHQQMPKHFFTEQFDENKAYVDADTMFAREEMYIRTVMRHILNSEYSDVIYAVDVVNEYINMANESPASPNHWKNMFGTEMKLDCEYVKKAFVWAYDELVNANRTEDVALFYNDYNTYYNTDKVISLINNINTVDEINTVGNICAGIGMQCHFNDDGATPDKFENALKAFAAENFEIQITELDVTNTGRVVSGTSEEDKAEVYTKNAEMYSRIMNAILTQKAAGANITSVTIWGLTDATSWRPDNAPLLFGTDVSDKKPSFDAVIDAAKNFGK